MAAVETAVRPQTQTSAGQWSSIFPSEQISEQQSALFVKKLLAVGVSTITYLRTIFPEHAFGDRCLEDLNLKILRDDSSCPGACRVIKWMKGCFDALDKKYLRALIIGLYVNSDDPDTVIESYTFKFSYNQDGPSVNIYRNESKISGASSEKETKKATLQLLRTIIVLTQSLKLLPDEAMMTMKLLYYDEGCVMHQGCWTAEFFCLEVAELGKQRQFMDRTEPMCMYDSEMVLQLLRTIIVLTQSLKVLPDKAMMSMRLLYYDEVTPAEYEPPGFQPAPSDHFKYEDEPMNIKVGDVSTQFHTLKLRMKTDKKQFDIQEDEDAEKEDQDEKNAEEISNKGLDEDEVVLISENQKQQNEQEPTSCNDVPVQSPGQPAGKSDEAAVITTPEVQEDEDDYPVKCSCGLAEDDGLMIKCEFCEFWQHAVCYKILAEEEAPGKHVCYNCREKATPDHPVTDPYLTELKPAIATATCLWRRALVAATEFTKIQAPAFAKRLTVEVTVARGLINRLEREGYIGKASKGKRFGKVIKVEKLKSDGIPKYFGKEPECVEPAAEDAVEKGTEAEDMDTNKHQNDVDQLAEKTSQMEVSSKHQISKEALTEHRVTDHGDSITTEKKTKKLPIKLTKSKKQSSRKRATISGNDFEVSDSQEITPQSGKKRRKASSVAKPVVV